jgi:hypothetical protein
MNNIHKSSVAATFGSLVLGAPLVSSAAAPKNLVELANMLANMFNGGATFLVMLAIIIFFSGVLVSLFNKGQGKIDGKELQEMLLWGIGIIFVMVSIWGIIRLLQGTLFGNSGGGSSAGSTQAPLQFNP